MLTVHHVSKSYDIHPILAEISFSIHPGDRLGLIGLNGSGKTTLLRILAGEDLPDQGTVISRPGLRIGYLAQGYEAPPGATLDEVLRQAAGDIEQLEDELAEFGAALALDPFNDNLQNAYDQALQNLQNLSRVKDGRIPAILQALGLSDINPKLHVGVLSGGQKTRLALALVLVGDPELLLLDEPTNHLDIEMLEWLEGWLKGFSGAAIIVSHDRTFLNHTVNRILDLDPETHRVKEYNGGYTDYLEQFLAEREKQMAEYKDQVYEVRRMRQDIARTKEQALQVERTTTPRTPGPRRYAKKVARKALAREKKLDRYLSSEERVEKPKESWQMKLEFGEPSHLGQDVLALAGVAVGYDGFPPLLQEVNAQVRLGQRVVLTGPNGAGKTTLLRAITGQIEPLDGRIRLGSSVRLGYMTQEQELLDPNRSGLETIQQLAPLNETDARSFLHYFLFSGDDPLRLSGMLSYGERARLALAALVVQGCNFLLLDEPINHLDIPSRTRFEQALAQFEGTVLAVVHDRYFIESFATHLWIVENGSLTVDIRDE